MATQSLVRVEGLVANFALESKLLIRWSGRAVAVRKGGGGGVSSAASEHEKAESKVFFLGGDVVLGTRPLRTLTLSKRVEAMEIGASMRMKVKGGRGSGRCWRVESF